MLKLKVRQAFLGIARFQLFVRMWHDEGLELNNNIILKTDGLRAIFCKSPLKIVTLGTLLGVSHFRSSLVGWSVGQ